MARMKLLLDTNVVIDFLHEREPYYDKARLLMTAGRVGEFDLWITSSQVTDLIYILSEGGKRSLLSRVLEQLRGAADIRERACRQRSGGRSDVGSLVEGSGRLAYL